MEASMTDPLDSKRLNVLVLGATGGTGQLIVREAQARGYEVIAGVVLPPSRARGLAVRAQMARAITATPDFLRASDADKQLVADEMLYFAAMANAGMQGARAEGSVVVKQWQAAARQGARRALRMDLAAMTLTDEGLRYRR
jgi:nucleoside-diphosphate-sugar epimerase